MISIEQDEGRSECNHSIPVKVRVLLGFNYENMTLLSPKHLPFLYTCLLFPPTFIGHFYLGFLDKYLDK